MNKTFIKYVTGFAVTASMLSTAAVAAPTALASTVLTESGSSLMYPLFTNEWDSAYQKAAGVTIRPASTGSGTGITDAEKGLVDIGASDAYLPPATLQAMPNMENIPLAVSAQQVMYNLPGISQSTHLKLSGNVLAQIYLGKITNWDNSQIQNLNKGVKLPNHKIILVHRSDSSGDSFLFTSYLTDTNAQWKSQVNESTLPSWPAVSGSLGASGNSGIVTALKNNPYSISYVGISYLKTALAANKSIGYAALENRTGNFELPTSANISADVNAVVSKVPKNEAYSLIYAPGKTSYPIVNFEYAIINKHQPNATKAAALRKFLNWAISPTGGNQSKYLSYVNFLPLPKSIEAKSQAQINQITG
ncbi:phosphate ABC transporter substrate-binding protein PstS [Alicyclobacillus cycloheptanicus]|uniref:Phosphate-binding protein n=1 Tax=Alicyclobacillus cycloheptanicus TaxID=1457 RepID=A0ABT9XLA6_9BACL|nr:phosphate ABC transporter substrate-binding protein PstS [Alicyclobacillus cycloheptanicus]MDQ0190804.1 phosphate transport system substrate-binding protein [Alicyclobacillus cycloheptanicus]WDM02715.1 phosphate ABC transporter substrate-binding protein PstS [Alicyclobacillus cycloheptanicus]